MNCEQPTFVGGN